MTAAHGTDGGGGMAEMGAEQTTGRPGAASATTLTTAHATLTVPDGAVPATVQVALTEGVALPAVPGEYQLLGVWRVAVAGGGTASEPVRFAQAGTLRLDLAALVPATVSPAALQVRRVAARTGRWLEVPVQRAPNGPAARVRVWGPGVVALVANTALARPPAVVEATIGPAGGTLGYARVQVTVPAGALAEAALVRLGPPEAGLPGWQGGLPFPFTLTARRVRDGQAITHLDRPLTLAVRFGAADVGNLPVDGLRLRRLDRPEIGSIGWATLPTTVDAQAGTLSAQTDHLSTFTTGGADVPSPFDFGTNWLKTDAFTGAVSLAMPLELPPGPGGLKPDLKLTHQSQASHWAQQAGFEGDSVQSASWIGEGFDIPLGYVSIATDQNNAQHSSVNVFGQGFRLLQDSGGRWHTTDEQFWQIAKDGTDATYSATNPINYRWRVITPDGTKYFFGIDPAQQDYLVTFDLVKGSQFATRFMLSLVVDPNGNAIFITYARLTKSVSCGGQNNSMTPAVYPTRLYYGGAYTPSNPTALPYQVVFNRANPTPPAPLDGGHVYRADVNVTAWIDDGCAQVFFDVDRLASLDVQVGGTLARRYVFTADTGSIPLVLQHVEQWSDAAGSERQRLLTVAYTDPPLQDTNICPAGGGGCVTGLYRLLASATNGDGGTTSFQYLIEYVNNFENYAGSPPVLWNGRAAVATQQAVDPGFGGQVRTTTATGYATPEGNPEGNGDVNWPDFYGHATVTMTDAASSAVYFFGQGQNKPDGSPGPYPGRITEVDANDLASPPDLVRKVQHDWSGVFLDPSAQGIRWTKKNSDTTTQQGTFRQTTYDYQVGQQGGTQYGRLTDIYEHDFNVLAPNPWLRHTKSWYFPGVAADRYVIDRRAAQTVYAWDGSTDGSPVRSTLSCYDGAVAWNTPIGGAGTDGSYRGLATATRRNADLPNSDRYQDTTMGYDQWGNRTTQTRWNSYGTATALANTDGRTTTTAYDPTYHAYKTQVTTPPTPNVPGGLVTRYGYDTVRNRLTSVVDPNGQTTTHTYDGLGRRVATWLPGDDPGQPGAATLTYRYLIGGGQPTRVQAGRRKDGGGGEFGRRSYVWTFYDGTGQVLQTQADFDRQVPMRAQDINDLLAAITADGGTAPFGPVGAGTSHILASNFTQLQGAIQGLWTAAGLGTIPTWWTCVRP